MLKAGEHGYLRQFTKLFAVYAKARNGQNREYYIPAPIDLDQNYADSR